MYPALEPVAYTLRGVYLIYYYANLPQEQVRSKCRI